MTVSYVNLFGDGNGNGGNARITDIDEVVMAYLGEFHQQFDGDGLGGSTTDRSGDVKYVWLTASGNGYGDG